MPVLPKGMLVSQARLRKGVGKFCSNICRNNNYWSQDWYRKQQTESHKGFIPVNIEQLKNKPKGKNSPHWKGDDVGYHALHTWVKKHLGKPNKCEFCSKIGTTPRSIQWANKSHEYKRDLNDWLRLCVPCHRRYDNNFKKGNLVYGKSDRC